MYPSLVDETTRVHESLVSLVGFATRLEYPPHFLAVYIIFGARIGPRNVKKIRGERETWRRQDINCVFGSLGLGSSVNRHWAAEYIERAVVLQEQLCICVCNELGTVLCIPMRPITRSL